MVKELKIKNSYLNESKQILREIKKDHYARNVNVTLKLHSIIVRHGGKEYVFNEDSVLSDIIEALNLAHYNISYFVG